MGNFKVAQFLSRALSTIQWLKENAKTVELSFSDLEELSALLQESLQSTTIKEPKVSLIWFLDECEHLKNISEESRHPEVIGPLTKNMQRTIRRGLALILENEPFESFTFRSFRWKDFSLSYISFWDNSYLEDRKASLDFTPLYLDRLAEKGFRTIWRQQKKVIKRASSYCGVISDNIPSISLDKIRKWREKGEGQFPGVFNTPFLMGRLSHLLGAPPRIQTPGVNFGPGLLLRARGNGKTCTVKLVDQEGHGIEKIEAYGSLETEDVFLQSVVEGLSEALLHSPQMEDCNVMAKHHPHWLMLGVKGGVLYQEVFDGYLPPWWLNWWPK